MHTGKLSAIDGAVREWRLLSIGITALSRIEEPVNECYAMPVNECYAMEKLSNAM